MKINLINEFHHHPKNEGSVGSRVLAELRSGMWKELRIAMAFARRSGVRYLSEAIREFSRNGRVQVVVGVKSLPTTTEALKELMAAVAKNGEVRVFHHQQGPTFHPKMYLFKAPGKAFAIVGSGNLTGGGLFGNYEAFLSIKLDCTRQADKKLLESMEEALDRWSKPSEVSRLLDTALLEKLVASGYVVPEKVANKEARKDFSKRPVTERLFGKIPVPRPPRPVRIPKVSKVNEKSPVWGGSDIADEFWLETGAMTGGSRNQLDFSKRSNAGNLGGIALFQGKSKPIKDGDLFEVIYEGRRYTPNVYKYGAGNGSWRIQLSGQSEDGRKLSEIGLVKKALIFGRVSPGVFTLRCVESAEIPALVARSLWNDRNPGSKGRRFGVLKAAAR